MLVCGCFRFLAIWESTSRTSNWEDSASMGRVIYPNPGYRQGPAQAKVERIASKRKSSYPMMNCARLACLFTLVLTDLGEDILATARMEDGWQIPGLEWL